MTSSARKSGSERLLEALATADRLLMVTHNNPDPDALGASVGLQYLYQKKTGGEAVIAYGGMVGRAENRAMVRHLDIEMTQFKDIAVERFGLVALVDTQPGTGNNPLPDGVKPAIVIDHHPARRRLPSLLFRSIATRFGATSSIIASIMQEMGLELSPRVATALLYGIKSDTQDLYARACPEDQEVYVFLFPQADKDLLGKIENAEVPRAYYEDVQKSLGQAVVRGKMVFSDIGVVRYPDMVAEMADFFLRLEDMRWSICVGSYGRDLFISVRTLDRRKHANWVASRLVAGLGTGGGHGGMAGGRVSMTPQLTLDDLRAEVKKRAIEILKLRRYREYKLVRESVQNNNKAG
jgi:nanoRNase/pAp phosphatase (c-di-AMP/oligoRNAs hydrolase)